MDSGRNGINASAVVLDGVCKRVVTSVVDVGDVDKTAVVVDNKSAVVGGVVQVYQEDAAVLVLVVAEQSQQRHGEQTVLLEGVVVIDGNRVAVGSFHHMDRDSGRICTAPSVVNSVAKGVRSKEAGTG